MNQLQEALVSSTEGFNNGAPALYAKAGTSEWPTLISPDQMGVFVGSGPKDLPLPPAVVHMHVEESNKRFLGVVKFLRSGC